MAGLVETSDLAPVTVPLDALFTEVDLPEISVPLPAADLAADVPVIREAEPLSLPDILP